MKNLYVEPSAIKAANARYEACKDGKYWYENLYKCAEEYFEDTLGGMLEQDQIDCLKKEVGRHIRERGDKNLSTHAGLHHSLINCVCNGYE